MEVVWSESSLQRVAEIGAFIAKDSPPRAKKFIDELIQSVDRLCEFPYSGPLMPENPAFRQMVFQRYRIIFRLAAQGVEIVTILSPGLLR